MIVMKHALALAIAAAALVATPVLAGPLVKRPLCQMTKAQPRDAKRNEQCRKQAIPPVIDPTPMFLASSEASVSAPSDLS